MIRQLFSATLLAAAVGASPLGAADSPPAARAKATPASQQKPGYGVVEQILPLRRASVEESASAGSSSPGRAFSGTYLVKVRMDDGSIQVRSQRQRNRGVSVGERVLLTNAGDVVPE